MTGYEKWRDATKVSSDYEGNIILTYPDSKKDTVSSSTMATIELCIRGAYDDAKSVYEESKMYFEQAKEEGKGL